MSPLAFAIVVAMTPPPLGAHQPVALPITGVVQLEIHEGLVCAANGREVLCGPPSGPMHRVWGGQPFVEVALSYNRLCARHGGEVLCTGINRQRDGTVQFSDTTYPLRALPVAYAVERASTIEADYTRACAATNDGVRCWPDATAERRDVRDAVDLALTAGGGCAVRAGGAIECWGPPAAWADVRQLTDAVAVDISANHACALRRGGGVLCWGPYLPWPSAKAGQLNSYALPEPAKSLTLGNGQICAVSGAGALCNGERLGVPDARAVAADGDVTCVATANEVWCWAPPPRPAEPAQREPAWYDDTVGSIADRIYIGGGRRFRPARASEKLLELGTSIDLSWGPAGKDSQPFSFGGAIDLRTSDFASFLVAYSLTAQKTWDDIAGFTLAAGAGGLQRQGEWQPVGLATARFGMRGLIDLDKSDRLVYTAEFCLYLSTQVSFTRPRVVDVTAGLTLNPLIVAALIYMPFRDN